MHGLSNKDCKQMFTMSVTWNTGTACGRNSSTSPTTFFFIINTGITTILSIFLILLAVSTNTALKINTICDSICCTCYFRQFHLKLLHSARWTEHAILGFLLELSSRNTPARTAIWQFSPCSHLQTWVPLEYSRFMLKWWCLNKKETLLNFLLLPLPTLFCPSSSSSNKWKLRGTLKPVETAISCSLTSKCILQEVYICFQNDQSFRTCRNKQF